MANERFVVNSERIGRFSEHLFAGVEEEEEGRKRGGEGNNSNSNNNTTKNSSKKKKEEEEWEDGKVRQARKRVEGLKIQAEGKSISLSNKTAVEKEEGEEEIDLPLFIRTTSSE